MVHLNVLQDLAQRNWTCDGDFTVSNVHWQAEEEDEDDDLATAFEVLDLGRVLFTRRLEAPEFGEDAGKGKESGDSAMTKHIKERLADTHHLLGEISLENEK